MSYDEIIRGSVAPSPLTGEGWGEGDYPMNEIRITPDLLVQYGSLTKNELLLHMAIKSLAAEGKLLRNLNQIGRTISKRKQRLLDAEDGLKRRGLLRIHWVGKKRWWYVYDAPIQANAPEATPLPAATGSNSPSPRGFFRKIYDVIFRTPLARFDLKRRGKPAVGMDLVSEEKPMTWR